MYLDVFNAAFPAKITGSTSSGGTWKYAWSEQRVVPTSGALETATEGRSGTTSVGYAVEMNNSEVATDTYVWMRVRASITGDLVYDFMAPDGTLAGGDSIAVIEEVDGSPSYTAISTLRFDSADGFVVTQPGTGIARVDIAAATVTQAGVVSTGDQSWAGNKTLPSHIFTAVSHVATGSGSATYRGDYWSVEPDSSGDSLGRFIDAKNASYGFDVADATFYIDNSHALEAGDGSVGTGPRFAGVFIHPTGITFYRRSAGFAAPTIAVRTGDLTVATGQTGTYAGLTVTCGLITGGSVNIDELAQDAVGAMVADTDTINVTYTDATPELKWDVRYQMSITSDASGIKLSGDATSPGNSYFYGTNGSGTKGWYATSTISAGLDINGLTANDIDVADEVPNYDVSATANRKVTIKRLAGYCNPAICDFRLTTVSGNTRPDPGGSAKSTIYWTPDEDTSVITSVSGYGRVALYDGTRWNLHLSAEISLALSGLTSGKNYDVFIYDNSGTLTIELSAAWSSDSARTDALALVDGVLVKDGTTTRRYVGTIRTTGTTTTEDSYTKRFVWNYYNRKHLELLRQVTAGNWSYSTNTWRQANATATNQVELVVGVPVVNCEMNAHCNLSGSNVAGMVGIGRNSTTVNSATLCSEAGLGATGGFIIMSAAYLIDTPPVGYHYYAWIEKSRAGAVLYRADLDNKAGIAGWFEG